MPAVVAPVTTVTLGGTDISAEVGAPLGGTSIEWGAGANFDGSSETAGTAVVIIRNDTKKFNPDNTGSPYNSVVKINQVLRISAVYASTTYYLFHGYITRIVPRDDKFVELHASDPLWRYARTEVSIPGSVSRQIQAFRGLILDAMGVGAGERSLQAENGPESMVPYTGADEVNGLGLLDELNMATGSFHFIRPIPTTYRYVTKDRLYLQTNAVVETFSPTDYTQPFPLIDYSDEIAESIINEQRVQATPRILDPQSGVFYQARHTISVNPGETRYRWAHWSDPAFNVTLSYIVETAGAAPTVTLTSFGRSAKITVTAGGSTASDGATIKGIKLSGTLATAPDISSVLEDAPGSITDFGLFRGSTIASDYLSSRANADGLAKWIVRRYRAPRARPTMTVQNRFPSQLVREVGQRIAVEYREFSWPTGRELLIRGFRTSVSGSGSLWTTKYDLERAPTFENLFTIGGTADQGVGGTAILGY